MTGAIDWHSEIAAEFDARYEFSPAFRERLDVWSALIDTYGGPDSDVLDAGCGSGVMTSAAAAKVKSVLGFDASPQMIGLARQRCKLLDNADFKVGRLGDRDIAAGRTFDVILCSSVLEYVDDLDGALDWLITKLKPGGILLVSMPNGASLYRKVERLAFKLTGRPRYYAHVRHVPMAAEFGLRLNGRELAVLETRHYAGPAMVRKLLGPHLGGNLFVVAAGLGTPDQ
ncbi:MAG: class I SAM-dependent methyltransferase [Hyphomicrobiales bacterium]|nr:class I SAM-dependent methyltransferase [Hyphomicrobiales bacterium]